VATVLAHEARAALERSGLSAVLAEHGRSLSRAIVAAALELERRDGVLVLRARIEERQEEPAGAKPAVVLELVDTQVRARAPRRSPRARR
jgi:hypothetical protein